MSDNKVDKIENVRFGFGLKDKSGKVKLQGMSKFDSQKNLADYADVLSFSYDSIKAIGKAEVSLPLANFLNDDSKEIVGSKLIERNDRADVIILKDTEHDEFTNAFHEALKVQCDNDSISMKDAIKQIANTVTVENAGSIFYNADVEEMVKKNDIESLKSSIQDDSELSAKHSNSFTSKIIALARLLPPYKVKATKDKKTKLELQTKGDNWKTLTSLCAEQEKFNGNGFKSLKNLVKGTMPKYEQTYKEIGINPSASGDMSFVMMVGNSFEKNETPATNNDIKKYVPTMYRLNSGSVTEHDESIIKEVGFKQGNEQSAQKEMQKFCQAVTDPKKYQLSLDAKDVTPETETELNIDVNNLSSLDDDTLSELKTQAEGIIDSMLEQKKAIQESLAALDKELETFANDNKLMLIRQEIDRRDIDNLMIEAEAEYQDELARFKDAFGDHVTDAGLNNLAKGILRKHSIETSNENILRLIA